MDKKQIKELSHQLKTIARDLTFLGHPRYPIKALNLIFPQHKNFISTLLDVSVPFLIDSSEKKREMDNFLEKLASADIPNQIKKLFTQRIMDYQSLIIMMENFGKRPFYEECLKLYGTADEITLDPNFSNFLNEIQKECPPDEGEKIINAEEGIKYLKEKLLEVFNPGDFEVKPSSSLLSDSSAGRRTLKLNPHKVYSQGQLNTFLVHEGWVHLGTSLNGASQEENPWLGTWGPRTTSLQEGLAICTELITGNMTIERWNKVVIRHLGTTMAERGSSVSDIYQYLLHNGLEGLDALKLSLRIFRGVPLEGGMAFTKELLYLHGLIKLLNHILFFKADLRSLWVGKISFDEHIILMDHWNLMNPQVKYFPSELEEPLVVRRLEKLKNLSINIFKHGLR